MGGKKKKKWKALDEWLHLGSPLFHKSWGLASSTLPADSAVATPHKEGQLSFPVGNSQALQACSRYVL